MLVRSLVLLAFVLLPPTASRAEPTRVAVLPMVVNAAGDRAYLRDGLSDMLAARLGRVARLAVVRLEDPALATTDSEKARAAARAVGADYALFGSFTRFGEGASLDVRCVSTSGSDPRDPRSIFIHAGALGELIPGVDVVAAKVVHHVTGEPAGPASAADRGASAAEAAALRGELDAVRQRLDELEASVYPDGDVGAAPEAEPGAPPLP